MAVYAVRVDEVVQNDGGLILSVQGKETQHPVKVLHVLPPRCADVLGIAGTLRVPQTGRARSPPRRGRVQTRVRAVA